MVECMVTVPKGQGELHVSSMLLEKERLSSKAVESLLLSIIHSMSSMQTCFIKRVVSLRYQKKWVARSLFIRIVDFHIKRDKQKGNTHAGIILGCDRETGCTKPVNIYIMRAHPTLQLQQSRTYICGDFRA